MPVCKSPVLTPTRLAALRHNARRSTGSPTARGKARSALNSLVHGRNARRLPELLAQAGEFWGERHYNWIREQTRKAFARVRPLGSAGWRRIDKQAVAVWCVARQASNNPNLEAGRETADGKIQVPGKMLIRIMDRSRGVYVVFWMQRCMLLGVCRK